MKTIIHGVLGVFLLLVWGCDQEITIISPGLKDTVVDSDVTPELNMDTTSEAGPSLRVVSTDTSTPSIDGEGHSASPQNSDSKTGHENNENDPFVDVSLDTGYMGANGTFTSTRNTVYTCAQHSESNQQFLIQIGAVLESDEGFDPDFVQFHFTSNTSEWVGTEGNRVFQSFEACDAAQQSCDEVII